MASSGQFLQQCLGLLEVGGVKALGEPAIDRGKQRFDMLALLLPQAAEAGGGAQFERLRMLATRHVEGLVEAGLRLGVVVRGLLQQS